MKDRNISTEYTGVYTGIFPNMSPREIELEARVKDLEEKLKKQNEELQTERNLLIKECDELKHLLKSERTRNRTLIVKYNKLKEKHAHAR